MTRFIITEGSRVFTITDSGILFENTLERSLCNGVASAGKELFSPGITTRGNFDCITIMELFNALRKQFRPVVVFSGVKGYFRRVNESTQTLHSVLPECYFHPLPAAGVDSGIFSIGEKPSMQR